MSACAAEVARLRTGQAILLGALHGPAELLPISSSAHVELVPRLLGWSFSSLDGELRKGFGVALHAGAAGGLLLALRGELDDALAPRRLGFVTLAAVPAALAGAAFERPVERRLGGPAQIAVGLILGAIAMLWADRRPALRSAEQANALDALALGAGQALALIPGVSRSGATLTAARARGFARPDAVRLSRHSALPVILGASGLKGARLWRRRLPPGAALPFAAGAAASFAGALAGAGLAERLESSPLALPAAYRIALGVLVLGRLGGTRSAWRPPAQPVQPRPAAQPVQPRPAAQPVQPRPPAQPAPPSARSSTITT
jgi:undecaprenyl-diphosphatase